MQIKGNKKECKAAMTATRRKTKLSDLEKQEIMRSSIPVESNSSTGSNNEEDHHRDNNSCYYPGCKKDANCTCQICLDSIYATIDLMPISINTSLSASRPKPNVDCTPISFDPSLLSTPTSTSTTSHVPFTPAIKSTARKDLNQKLKKHKKGQNGYFSASRFLILLLGLGLLLSADISFSWVASGIFQPALSPDVVKRVGEKCLQVQDLNGKLRLLQKDLSTSIVDGKVSNCILSDSTWKISQDGVLLNSRCILYKSAIEEVSIWGWPLQTAGLLTNGFSFKSFTILSGRVTQWNSGQVGYVIRKANTSWVQPKWGASVVQLDPNTWVLEYQRSSIVNGTSFYSPALEFLQYRIPRIIGRVKKCFWRLAAFEVSHYNRFTATNGIKTPT